VAFGIDPVPLLSLSRLAEQSLILAFLSPKEERKGTEINLGMMGYFHLHFIPVLELNSSLQSPSFCL
jgi:hypothetical protein